MTVFFVSPATTQEPIGGIKKIYDEVDILNAAGVDAAVIQGQRGFRPTWFANDTRIEYAPVEIHGSDVLVWPEYLLRYVRRADIRQVLFVQNAYALFADGDAADDLLRGATDPSLTVVTVSDDNADYIRHGWPTADVSIVRAGIDPAVFHPGTAGRRIAYSPRKRSSAVRQVLGLLQARGALAGWELAPIENLTERQVAEALRGSALFLSFSEREGFGLPPLEALASGCHVIGFTGMGGREIFDPRYTEAIPEDDIVAFARAVETWLTTFDAAAAASLGREGSAWALEQYSLEQERAAVVDLYARLLETERGSGSTIIRPDETWGVHDRPRSNVRRGIGQIRAGLRTMGGR